MMDAVPESRQPLLHRSWPDRPVPTRSAGGRRAAAIERAVVAATQMFARTQFAAVSVKDIAAAAQCSTATIYEVFGSKEALFRAAVEAELDQRIFPALREIGDAGPMGTLLDYLKQRIEYLANPDHRTANRLLAGNIALAGDSVRNTIDEEYRHVVACIGSELRKGRASGLFRRLDIDVMTHAIVAGTAYEALTVGFFAATALRFQPAEILRQTLLPLVTERGRFALEAFLERNFTSPGRERGDDAASPLSPDRTPSADVDAAAARIDLPPQSARRIRQGR